ncbi:hypothetical protein Y032_0115g487 [Ancylostoma ceylanicum]|uniref:Uncharacterized protein n=1 Tax=Ancylostoma ceylanicum TaxID=53326 RepID=A0A016TBX5_9BILA|nr:hypothetical protein Y032_0115g487 [Ancylostoma ceylanicum]
MCKLLDRSRKCIGVAGLIMATQAFGTQLLAIDLCFCGLVALRIACPGILGGIEADADAGGHSLALTLLELLALRDEE